MKCKGIKNPEECLKCKFDECIADELGNLPSEKEQHNSYRRRYYADNKEHLREMRNNVPEYAREQRRARQKRYRERNPEKVRESRMKYKSAHREEINAKKRELQRRMTLALKYCEKHGIDFESEGNS